MRRDAGCIEDIVDQPITQASNPRLVQQFRFEIGLLPLQLVEELLGRRESIVCIITESIEWIILLSSTNQTFPKRRELTKASSLPASVLSRTLRNVVAIQRRSLCHDSEASQHLRREPGKTPSCRNGPPPLGH